MDYGGLAHADQLLAEHDPVVLWYSGYEDRQVVAEAEDITRRDAAPLRQKFLNAVHSMLVTSIEYQGMTYVMSTGIAQVVIWRTV